MKNIALFIISDGIGGAEQVVWQTLNSLKSQGNIYFIVNAEIYFYYEAIVPYGKIFNIGNIYTHPCQRHKLLKHLLNNRLFSFINLIIRSKTRQICDFLNTNSIKILHAHLEYALFSSLLAKKKSPSLKVFFSVHGVFGLLPDSILKPEIPLRKLDFSQVDCFIFVSKYVYTVFENHGIPIKNFRIIYNGVDRRLFQNFERIHLKNEIFTVLYVGGSKYVKGYDYLIETTELLMQKVNNLKLKVNVLGPLPVDCELVRLIKERSLTHIFELHGFVPPPSHLDYFKTADLLFMPSRDEALGIAAIEAMFFDLPIVASNIGGLHEVIKNGENGFVCSCIPTEYAKYIQIVIDDYENILKKTKKYNSVHRNLFNIENSMKNLLDLYKTGK